jgi:hypothetical protein
MPCMGESLRTHVNFRLVNYTYSYICKLVILSVENLKLGFLVMYPVICFVAA